MKGYNDITLVANVRKFTVKRCCGIGLRPKYTAKQAVRKYFKHGGKS